MAASQGGGTNENSAPVEIKDKVHPENEIDLIDYFRVLWKRKCFIFLATVLPTLIVGITLFLGPKSYKVTYVYDVRDDVRDNVRDNARDDAGGWNLNEENYTVLLNRFYSEENVKKLSDKLRKNGLERYAEQLSNRNDSSNEFVKFEAIPPFLDFPKLTITDPDQIKKIRDMKALLLNVTILGQLEDPTYKASLVIRDNIKTVIPLYIAQEQLSDSIRDYNNELANIEHNRFNLELVLKNSREILAGLKNVNTGVFDNKQEGIVLQFNVGEQNQYLPLSYQIQAAESKRIEAEERIKANEEKYKYYTDLLDLNNKILAELDSNLSSDYTTEQFRSFLTRLVASCEKPQLKDYLNSYIRKIENRIATSKPVIEKPKISSIAKGTAKKSGVIFAILLMTAVFAAFLLESFEKSNTRGL